MHLRGARRKLPRAHELLGSGDHVDQEVASPRLMPLDRAQLRLRLLAQPLVSGVETARVVLVVQPVLEPLALEEVGLGQQLRARRRREARALVRLRAR